MDLIRGNVVAQPGIGPGGLGGNRLPDDRGLGRLLGRIVLGTGGVLAPEEAREGGHGVEPRGHGRLGLEELARIN